MPEVTPLAVHSFICRYDKARDSAYCSAQTHQNVKVKTDFQTRPSEINLLKKKIKRKKRIGKVIFPSCLDGDSFEFIFSD